MTIGEPKQQIRFLRDNMPPEQAILQILLALNLLAGMTRI